MTVPLSISVIVPLYNAADWIDQALDSVVAQATGEEETTENETTGGREIEIQEIIIVNDGSTDGSGDRVRDWGAHHPQAPLRLWEQANAGPSAARNAGLEQASGAAIAFLDADDYWPVDALVQHARVMARHDADIARGLSQLVSANREPLSAPFRLPGMPTALVRRSAFERVGFFDPQLRGSEDVDWFLRAEDAGIKLVEHEALVHFYRRHGANTTEGKSLAELEFHRVLKRALDRRRAAR